MYKKIACIMILVIGFSCSNDQAKEEKQEDTVSARLIGEWNNIYMKVDIHSKKNTASSQVVEITQAQWQDKLKIKPIRTFFRADSTWNSAHYNLNDSLVFDPSGRWWLSGDKLTMLQLQPFPDTTVYTFTLQNDTASFTCMLDWDNDGSKDDRYFGKQVKRSN